MEKKREKKQKRKRMDSRLRGNDKKKKKKKKKHGRDAHATAWLYFENTFRDFRAFRSCFAVTDY